MSQSNIAVKPVAGPEMDAAIAEHVFGWKRVEGEEACFEALPHMAQVKPWMRHVKCIWIDPARPDVYRACLECGSMPAFSTEIAEAWKVVEKLLTMGPQPSVEVRSARDSQDMPVEYTCTIDGTKGYKMIADATETAATAPLCICLAALRAVGIEVSE